MAGLLSTLKKTCKVLFKSTNSTIKSLKNWFDREISTPVSRIISTVCYLYRKYMHPLAIPIAFLAILVIINPSVIIMPLLSLLGFTVLGPAAGSMAASIQSMIGNVVAGSWFALLQSAGMLGGGLAVVCSGVGIAVVILPILLACWLWRKA